MSACKRMRHTRPFYKVTTWITWVANFKNGKKLRCTCGNLSESLLVKARKAVFHLIYYLVSVFSKTMVFPSGKTRSHLSLVAGLAKLDSHSTKKSRSWTDIISPVLTELGGPLITGYNGVGGTVRRREEGKRIKWNRFMYIVLNGRKKRMRRTHVLKGRGGGGDCISMTHSIRFPSFYFLLNLLSTTLKDPNADKQISIFSFAI